MIPLIKENLCWKSEKNVEWCSKKQEKIMSTDTRANGKQQPVTVLYKWKGCVCFI